MFGLVIAIVILALAPACVWAVRSGGARRLWALCGLSLVLVAALGLVLSSVFDVPSTGRVLVYGLSLLSPPVLLTATLLTLFGRTWSRPNTMIVAYGACTVGLIIGFGS